MPFITGLAAFDPERDILFDDGGFPCEIAFGAALSVWRACQNRVAVPVAEAAIAFNADPDVIRMAIEDHPWLFIQDDAIYADGE